MIRLSVIIPTFQRAQAVYRLLDSLSIQSLPQDQFEILVVSNFFDKKLDWLVKKAGESQKNLRLLVAGAKGANASRNLGIREAIGELLLLLDDDCILESMEYLQTIIDHHVANPTALAIGGTYSIPEECGLEDIAYNIISRDWQLSNLSGTAESLRLLGGNVSYKKALLQEAGELFNPKISYGGAELEFHSRLVKKGARLLLFPELAVHHVPEMRRSEQLVKKAYKQARTAVEFSIAEGVEENRPYGYHSRRDTWALKNTRNESDLERVCELVAQYDRAYNMVVQDRVLSLPHLKARLWAEKAARILTSAR